MEPSVITKLKIHNHEMGISNYKKQPPINKKGYTLIEILVSLSVIGIIFSFGYASFRDFSRRQAIADTAKMIQGDLRFAQQNAIAGQKPEGCGASNTLESYSFNIIRAAAPSEYSVEANCGGTPISVKDVSIPGISLSIPSPNPLKFKVLGQGTNIGDADWILTVSREVTGDRSTTVTVTSGGEIK
ncbi:MAG: protein of unknown function with transmembrane region [Microgenomates group bacterium GW2011_GWC1_43_13]|uniref:Type II secretory pathway protein LspH n=3 Tax=Candidatus Woeseibacteriota TaxID=1752722 RepID=A0A837I9E6_9BACT|nr:MAG: protein of unknown function with transmembrane region [Microgenomates group bacterium GW2011_GWC1_43_13]KKT54287.1 MAG: type II secretory pathway protein LspH [Candidatus Woesebacteria bacterium GW2011_GWA1_44_23]